MHLRPDKGKGNKSTIQKFLSAASVLMDGAIIRWEIKLGARHPPEGGDIESIDPDPWKRSPWGCVGGEDYI